MGLGYMSEATICGVKVLATGSSIAPSYEKLPSSGARGAGYLYAGLSVFAWDYARWEGSLEWDLGNEGSFGPVANWAVTNRNQDQTITAKPGGGYEMSITGKNSGFSGSTSQNSLVSMSASALALGEAGSIGGNGGGEPGDGPGNTQWCGDNGVIPYWMTSATVSNGGGGSCGAIEWGFQITNSVVPVFCCSGATGTHSDPHTILLGPTEATANATFWDSDLPSDFWSRDIEVTINLSVGTVTVIGVIESTDISIQTGESIVGAGITVKGVACNRPCVTIG